MKYSEAQEAYRLIHDVRSIRRTLAALDQPGTQYEGYVYTRARRNQFEQDVFIKIDSAMIREQNERTLVNAIARLEELGVTEDDLPAVQPVGVNHVDPILLDEVAP